jgi:taurine dioxygenase
MPNELSTFRRIRVRPVTGALGAEVEGVDLSNPHEEEFAEVHRAWLQCQVLFFRNQVIDAASIESLGSRFGPLTVTTYTNTVPGYRFAHSLVREAGIGKGERNFGDSWHIDQTVRRVPNAGFILYAVNSPPYGGDTGFSSLYAAYDGLSTGMQALCESLVAVHSPSGLFGPDGQGGPGKKPFMLAGADKVYRMTPDAMRDYMRLEMQHPLICVHPESGRKLIYITGYVTRFVGMTEEESRPLLDYLTAHVVRPEFTCRFRWRERSAAIIDNRCLQHIAYQDYSGFRREMLRVEFTDNVEPFGPAKPRQ